MTSAERRQQIVAATLSLLGELPVERLTTRHVAKRVGVSQPALFRHFQSRNAILAEVVNFARSTLEERATASLENAVGLEAVGALAEILFGFAEEHPGLPRLLFHDASDEEEALFHLPLRTLISSQRVLVAECVRQAQVGGQVSSRIVPEEAADLFISLVQGTLLQWQHAGRTKSLAGKAREIASFWAHGLAPDAQEHDSHETSGSEPSPSPCKLARLAALDVRPILASGSDPLSQILRKLDGVAPTGVLEVVAPFRPAPLLTLLTKRGHCCETEELGGGVHRLWIRLDPSIAWLDLRELEAPEPLERLLGAIARLREHDEILAALPRYPRLLTPHLDSAGLSYEIQESVDGCALLSVRKPLA